MDLDCFPMIDSNIHLTDFEGVNEYKIPALTPGELKYFSNMIEKNAGINIKKEKIKLLENRLTKRLRGLNFSNYSQYRQYLETDREGNELQLFVNGLTTNKTDFFRERSQYDFLKNRMQKIKNFETLYCWSAACSTGEEVYSLALLYEEIKCQRNIFDYRILGTDIDTRCIEEAFNGEYEVERLSKISSHCLNKYFNFINNINGNKYSIGEKLRAKVKFRQHNLINYSEVPPIKFDIIFLRNVLFYFPLKTSEKIVKKMIDSLVPGGILLIGLTETLNNMNVNLVQIEASIYEKVAA